MVYCKLSQCNMGFIIPVYLHLYILSICNLPLSSIVGLYQPSHIAQYPNPYGQPTFKSTQLLLVKRH